MKIVSNKTKNIVPSEKNFDSIIDLIPSIPLPKDAKHRDCYLSIITISLQIMLKNNKINQNFVQHLCDCYVKLLNDVAATKAEDLLEKVWYLLNLESNYDVFGDQGPLFLNNITNIINNKWKKIEDKSTVTVYNLTKCLLVYVKIEQANKRTDMKESLNFIKYLKQSEGIPLEHINILEYTLKLYISSKETHILSYSNELWIQMQKCLTDVQNPYQIDVAATISEISSACFNIFVKNITSKKVASKIFLILNHLYKFLENTKNSKSICKVCQKHELNNYYIFYFKLLTECMEHIEENYIEVFCKMIKHYICHLNEKNCQPKYYTQMAQGTIIKMLTSFQQNKQYAHIGISLLHSIIKQDVTAYVSSIKIMQYLANFFQSLDDTKECIRVGYIWLIFLINIGESFEGLGYVLYHMVIKQQVLLPEPEQVDIGEYLAEINWNYYGLDIPRISLFKLYMTQLRGISMYSFKETQLAIKTIEYIFKETTNPLEILQISHYYDEGIHFEHKQFYNSIQQAYNDLKSMTLERNDDKIKKYSVFGNVKWLQYRWRFTEISGKCKEAFSDLTDIEPYQTLQSENELIELLLTATQCYKKLASLLHEQGVNAKVLYNLEIETAIKNLIKIGNHLNIRTYKCNAVNTFHVLYFYAKMYDDTFAIIHAVTFFAEHSTLFANIFPTKELGAIIESGCLKLTETMASFEKLSLRKQNAVLFCFMAIAEYYIGENRVNDAKSVLKFVEDKLFVEPAAVKMNSVKMKYYSLLVLICTKSGVQIAVSPMQFIEYVMTSAKTIEYKTPEDTIAVPLIFYKCFEYLTNYLLARFDVNEIPICLQMLLKLSGRMGLVLKTIKLLIQLSHVDLKSENFAHYMNYFNAFDKMLMLNCNETMQESQNKENTNKIHNFNNQVSPLRKQIIFNTITPIKTIQNGAHSCKYFLTHNDSCDCALCAYKENKCVLFEIAELYCQTFFIDKNYQNALRAYESLLNYWREDEFFQDNSQTEIANILSDNYQLAVIRMLINYAACLSHIENYELAIDTSKTAMQCFRKLKYPDESLKTFIEDNIAARKVLLQQQMFNENAYEAPKKAFVHELDDKTLLEETIECSSGHKIRQVKKLIAKLPKTEEKPLRTIVVKNGAKEKRSKTNVNNKSDKDTKSPIIIVQQNNPLKTPTVKRTLRSKAALR